VARALSPALLFWGGDFAAHDPEKPVLDLIGDGYRFSDKIMRHEQEFAEPSPHSRGRWDAE